MTVSPSFTKVNALEQASANSDSITKSLNVSRRHANIHCSES